MSGETGIAYGIPPPRVMALLYRQLPDGPILTVGAGEDDGNDSAPAQTVFRADLQPPSFVAGERFTRCDALCLPFGVDSFTGALAKDVLEHTLDPLGILIELSRVVRPRGQLLLTVPQAKPRVVWQDPTHIRGFTRGAIEKAAAASGWGVDRIQGIGGIPGLGRVRMENRLLDLWDLPLASRLAPNWLAILTNHR